MEAVNHIQLSIPRALTQVTLRALIYAILFQRNMEAVKPQTFDALDAAVVCAPTDALEKEIRGKLDDFASEYLETRAPKGELAVVFLQKRPRKGWFATTEELIPWELHLITLDFTSSPDRYGATSGQNVPSLVPALTQILMFCADKRHAVPPLGGADSGLSYQIMINPPSPSDLFSPSPPLPARSPPPVTGTTIATATATLQAQARDTAHGSPSSAARELREARGDRGDRDRGDRWDRGERDRAERRGSAPAPGSHPHPPPLSPSHRDGYRDRERDDPGQQRGPGHVHAHAYAVGGTGYGGGGHAGTGAGERDRDRERDAVPGGYLDAAKDGLRAVRAGAGAVAHWAGRGR